ncbi:MAG TPA: hypothetical protein VFS43_43855 [Polyangiaceae bacterium]|nr:hypothetical protein [Polyangiaceae bacterium]
MPGVATSGGARDQSALAGKAVYFEAGDTSFTLREGLFLVPARPYVERGAWPPG